MGHANRPAVVRVVLEQRGGLLFTPRSNPKGRALQACHSMKQECQVSVKAWIIKALLPNGATFPNSYFLKFTGEEILRAPALSCLSSSITCPWRALQLSVRDTWRVLDAWRQVDSIR